MRNLWQVQASYTQSKPHKKLNKRNRVLKFRYCSLACSPWLMATLLRMTISPWLSCFDSLGAVVGAKAVLVAPWSAFLDAAAARRCL